MTRIQLRLQLQNNLTNLLNNTLDVAYYQTFVSLLIWLIPLSFLLLFIRILQVLHQHTKIRAPPETLHLHSVIPHLSKDQPVLSSVGRFVFEFWRSTNHAVLPMDRTYLLIFEITHAHFLFESWMNQETSGEKITPFKGNLIFIASSTDTWDVMWRSVGSVRIFLFVVPGLLSLKTSKLFKN